MGPLLLLTGGGEALTYEQVLRRYVLVEGTTQVWDLDKARTMKKTAFEARVGKPLAKQWMDDTQKKLISDDKVKEIEQARKMAGKKGGALNLEPIERYVYIDGTKDVWDRERSAECQRAPSRWPSAICTACG